MSYMGTGALGPEPFSALQGNKQGAVSEIGQLGLKLVSILDASTKGEA